MRSRTPTLLLLLMISGAAVAGGAVSPTKIERLAEEAATDERSMQKLVKLLGSDDPATRTAAEQELVALGTIALPYLRTVIIKREDFAGAALIAIGKMGNPDTFELLTDALEDPQLSVAARQAWVEAEAALWTQVQSATNVRVCDKYIHAFPAGPHREGAERQRYEIEAREALSALGNAPDAARLERFIEQFPGTAAEASARRGLAELNVDSAETALRGGRPLDALERIADAKRWDPTYDVRSVEGRARLEQGRTYEKEGHLDEAISAMEDAVELGNVTAADYLARYSLDRAASDIQTGNLRRAMADIDRVSRLSGALAEEARVQRDELIRTMFAEISAGGPRREEAAAALALAGSGPRGSLRSAVLGRVLAGDPYPLRGVSSALSNLPPDDESSAWLGVLLADAVVSSRGPAESLASDSARVAALLRPADMWSDGARADRAAALGTLGAFEMSLELARKHQGLGGHVETNLPSGPLKTDDELARMLLEGARPTDTGLALLTRIQLMRHVAWSCRELESITQADPARVALQFVGRPRLPADAAEWSVLSDDARVRSFKSRYPAPLADGGVGDLSHLFSGDTLELVLRLPDSTAISEGVVSDGLTMLFGMARLVMAVFPAMDRFSLAIGDRDGDGIRRRMTLALSRQDARSMPWSAIEAAAPYGLKHLSLVPYREPR